MMIWGVAIILVLGVILRISTMINQWNRREMDYMGQQNPYYNPHPFTLSRYAATFLFTLILGILILSQY